MDSAGQTEQTRRFFDMAAAGWTARYGSDAAVGARKARFLSAVQTRFDRPADILDFGCGSGDIALHLSNAGHRLTGYDLSPQMIAQAQQVDRDHRVQWVARGDNEDLPFADASFHAVVASSVLEYVANLDATLKELARVLRPGGWLIVTVPDMRHPVRHRERWLRAALTVPGLASLVQYSSWREGANYLQISINRVPPKEWAKRLRSYDFNPDQITNSVAPLLMITSQRIAR